MSGIYIPNMSLPKYTSFPLSICITKDGTVTDSFGCPIMADKAIELPPHGRLIDADKLRDTLIDYRENGYISPLSHMSAIRALTNATTIIPADPEGGADG